MEEEKIDIKVPKADVSSTDSLDLFRAVK